MCIEKVLEHYSPIMSRHSSIPMMKRVYIWSNTYGPLSSLRRCQQSDEVSLDTAEGTGNNLQKFIDNEIQGGNTRRYLFLIDESKISRMLGIADVLDRY
jgi:hypothetical protein